ncbi:MAG TPA: response regulator, partial [Tepidisphaeraceae bacterium]|nr:response regulator [Tepidisphaeraceae bacterium]
SGTVIVDVGDVSFRDLHDYVDRTFRHVAESKKLDFAVLTDPLLPRGLQTDAKRLQQILKNLLSNAFKFTDKGSVTLEMQTATAGWNTENQFLNNAKAVIAFSVRDTGIGIPPEKQAIIFEAFQQADGSTSRKYGGTGLGLAISRELAHLLGGEIRLVSQPGGGSTFTLYLPQAYVAPKPVRRVAEAEPEGMPETVVSAPVVEESPISQQVEEFGDEQNMISPSDRVVLVVENDPSFARILVEIAHENKMKAIVTARGASALSLARELSPHAITLDINLPDIDGWRVLDRLKDELATRHVPVQVITTDEERSRGLRMGAVGVLTKPIRNKESLDHAFEKLSKGPRNGPGRLLLAVSDEQDRARLIELLGAPDVEIVPVSDGAAVINELSMGVFDLLVLGWNQPDVKPLDLIDDLREIPSLADFPILLYSTQPHSKKEELHIKRLTQTTVLRDVRSPERLFDAVSLFLHRPLSQMNPEKWEMLNSLHSAEAVLSGKHVLVVDDDIRNIFAMTSILEPFQMQVMSAETGREAIDLLQRNPEIDVVLMDIMMPEMDGYDTMRAIRKLSKFRALPIIALTATAMKGDREKCIEAGASDYISKPVDTQQLLGLLRLWLHR